MEALDSLPPDPAYSGVSLQKNARMKTKEMLEYRHPEGLTRIRKRPVFLCHARCFYSAREAEDFAREMGRRITGTRKHYMKGTDITLYLLDFTTKIKTEDE